MAPRCVTAKSSPSSALLKKRRYSRRNRSLERFEAGFQIPDRHRDAGIEPAVPIETDDLLELTIRMCRVFFRSTGVNEYTFRQRLGSKANIFFDQVLPSLKGYGVVDEIEYKGRGVRGATGSGYPSMTCNGRSNRLTATSRSFWKASAPDRPPGPLAGRYQSRESGTSSHAPPCSIDAWLTSPGRVMSIAASMPSSGSVPSRTASTKSSI